MNDRLEASIDELKSIVLAERLKRSEAQVSADQGKLLERAQRCLLENQRDRVQQILATFQPHSEAQGRLL